jgi:phosphotransferase system enzyme I (PtsI)
MDGKVAEYYNPGHLAVLRLIKLTVRAAKKAKIPVSVCGEMAGIPKYAVVLIGMGIKELSMASANIPRVKDRIRKISFAEAKWLAGEILSFTDNKKIDKKLEAFELKFWQ